MIASPRAIPVLLLTASALMGCTQAAFGETAPLTAVTLRCEYLTNPIGIDVIRPRLSWTLTASGERERGLLQSAYQVLVAGSREALATDDGNLWDSGRVQSHEMNQIEYAGKTLVARQYAYWKVRIWDQQGRVSA